MLMLSSLPQMATTMTRKKPPPQGLLPGNQVLLRNLHPGSLQTRWSGPHTVILTTPTAAKLSGHQVWVHINNLKRAPTGNGWASQAVGPTKLTSKIWELKDRI